MNEIEMLQIEQLRHHPENPRLDLGDLSELTASIKANGILQNLTVIRPDNWKAKDGDIYWVLIGNRRLDAAKAAGLTELPCQIVRMGHTEQIATMLQENMQRSDLTVYEQAKGIQMMLDLGFTKDQVVERTGFSRATVDRRLAVASLPEKETKKAVQDGVDLLTLVELAKVEDPEEREFILNRADGTNTSSTRADIKRAIVKQERKKLSDRLLPEIERFAKPLKNDSDRWSSKYEMIRSMTIKLTDDAKVIIPEDAGKQSYYYSLPTYSDEIEFFRPAKKQKQEKTPEEIAMAKRQADAKQLNKSMRERRIAFVQVFTPSKKTETELKNKCFEWAFGWKPSKGLGPYFVNYHSWVDDNVRLYLDMPEEEGHDESTESLMEECKRRGVPFGRLVLAWMLCGGLVDSSRKGYCSEYRGDYTKDTDMDRVYEVLAAAGYQLNEEEQQWKDGSHEFFTGGKA